MKQLKIILAVSCLPLLCQAQTFFNNGATLYVSTGATLQVNGDLQNQSTSLLTNNGMVNVLGSVTNHQTMVSPNNGTLAFIGSTAQSLNGTVPYFANNVLVNNANGVTLNTPLKVNGNTDFTNGIVLSSATNPVLFTATGSHSNTNNASHVNGVVVKEGIGSFDYPVGDGTNYQKINATLSANSNGMQAKYNPTNAGGSSFSATGSEATLLVAYNPYEHWDLTPLGTATGTVTVFWDGVNNAGIGNVADLKVAHLSGSNWLNEGTTGTGTIASGSVTSNSLSTWSPFTLGSISMSSPLPISLLSFNGKKEATANVLNWITASELNNNFFTIERSFDAKNYVAIGQVNSIAFNGNSSTNLNYELQDVNYKAGHNYYRLLQTDIDGKTNIHSQVVDLYRDANGNVVHVFPNPTTATLNVECYLLNAGSTTVKLSDASGRIIKELQTTASKGNNLFQLDVNEVALGIYMLQVIQHNQVISTQKVEKQ